MPEFAIRYLPASQRDLLKILRYIKRDNPAAASTFIQLIEERIALLADFPLLGVVLSDVRLKKLGYRLLVVENYLVFYVVKDRIVEIRRVIHGRRRYEFLF